jgi:uncharacterized membrane protein YhaH (DUF805 family)
MEWFVLPLKRYAEFDGRSRRLEYWCYNVLWWVVTVFVILTGATISGGGHNWTDTPTGMATVAIFGIWLFATFIPGLALAVRRWHDLGQSGWFVLLFGVLSAIPLLGLIVALGNVIWFFMPGTTGDNEYGPDPKADIYGEVAEPARPTATIR